MPTYKRILYGFAAGLVLVVVRMMTEKGALVSFYKAGNYLDLQIMFLFFACMLVLGALGGLFSDASNRHGILMYCAALPGLLATGVAPQVHDGKIETGRQGDVSGAHNYFIELPSLITKARAQDVDFDADVGVCDESYSFSDFTNKLASRFAGRPLQTFDVIVASKPDIKTAFETAMKLADQTGLDVSVGCRIPDNQFYPVLIGKDLPAGQAFELKAEFLQKAPGSEDPYLSDYQFRTDISVTPAMLDGDAPQ